MKACPRFRHDLQDRQGFLTLKRFSSARTVQPAVTHRKASSFVRSYVSTSLAKHKDGKTFLTHGIKINDQPSDRVTFQSGILHTEKGSAVECVTLIDI